MGCPVMLLAVSSVLSYGFMLFFPTVVAYAISQALTRFIAFFGMYILLKKTFDYRKTFRLD
ncbi:DUF6044 family protein [Peribacillus frigoritolerans]|nr:DUF6044 family protein [Peribacillus frigoritolerans]